MVDASIALVIAGVATWAVPKFIIVPFCNLIGWHFTWWMYAILFLLVFGSVSSGLMAQRATENIAYGKTTVKLDGGTKVCPQCGHGSQPSDRFCPNCGRKNA